MFVSFETTLVFQRAVIPAVTIIQVGPWLPSPAPSARGVPATWESGFSSARWLAPRTGGMAAVAIILAFVGMIK